MYGYDSVSVYFTEKETVVKCVFNEVWLTILLRHVSLYFVTMY